MNSFDLDILIFLNQFSQTSWTFDSFIRFLSRSALLKGGVLVAILWWAWFKQKEQVRARGHIVLTLLGCSVAMALARVLASTLPFRPRPLHVEGLNFTLPYTMNPGALGGWSSFPSDHAVLFFCLATGILFVSKRAGIFALLYTCLVIAFPRLYLGLHYPTDILVGAAIGATVAILVNRYLVKHTVSRTIVNWSYSAPTLFYPIFFLVTYQVADMFDGVREMFNLGLRLLRAIII